jgi:hypothetical protein
VAAQPRLHTRTRHRTTGGSLLFSLLSSTPPSARASRGGTWRTSQRSLQRGEGSYARIAEDREGFKRILIALSVFGGTAQTQRWLGSNRTTQLHRIGHLDGPLATRIRSTTARRGASCEDRSAPTCGRLIRKKRGAANATPRRISTDGRPSAERLSDDDASRRDPQRRAAPWRPEPG